ncbi:MAG: B12-binding domain-containing radical SAM protein [Elusimicrobia bacterium]|nr:B12-binding domain-containing radical SAM protein [Elusimicrobiota bacterium]
MRIRFIYPAWQRLEPQTHYVLPPLGVAMAAELTPSCHEVSIEDDNIAPVDAAASADLVGISLMLAAQAPRAFAIADAYRRRGVPVVIGGLSARPLADACAGHADAVVLGEAEGVWPALVRDASQGRLRPLYRREGHVPPREFAVPRRDLLDAARYAYRGLPMMELLETSRGCRFACPQCQVPALSGTRLRARPLRATVEEATAIAGERVFIVDNSPEQDEAYEKRLFRALAGLGKRWVSHSISDTPEILRLAERAGWWFVLQTVTAPSPRVRERIRRYHDHGIAVGAFVTFGLDEHGPDSFGRIVDFLKAARVDTAEFNILTPYPGTPLFGRLKREGRLLHEDWGLYNSGNVVFRPKRMSQARLARGVNWAWQEYYREQSQAERMFRIYRKIARLKDFKPEAGPSRRVIPYQSAGTDALWGRAVRP